MCKIFSRTKQLQLSSPSMGDVGLGKKIPSRLPLGFHFRPTDEELITHYLRKRANAEPCPVHVIAEVDIYKFDPWDLPARDVFGYGEWYFFSPRDRKYPNGVRPNRAAGSGYWKAAGTDNPIQDHATGVVVGVKKALVFYKGRPPKGIKTSWIMHEYRLSEALGAFNNYRRPMRTKMDDWVLCRIYKSNKTTLQPLYSSTPHQASNNLADCLPGSELSQTLPTSHVGPILDYIVHCSAVSELFETLPTPPETTTQPGTDTCWLCFTNNESSGTSVPQQREGAHQDETDGGLLLKQ